MPEILVAVGKASVAILLGLAAWVVIMLADYPWGDDDD